MLLLRGDTKEDRMSVLMSLGHLFHHLVLLVNHHLLHLILSQTTRTVSKLFSSCFFFCFTFHFLICGVESDFLYVVEMAVEHCFSMNLEVLS
ncbi:hypothetical protein OIU74_014375 [Salix koriyanagi]|uniref:Uncharacterized protein n=1 Tax=Salix koriyanagi TaxID=2511006 RepID=A0A9Q0PW91_9ROSI|nr:hypothetical protein OIU74_014375 [Salix koriyanagi]